MLHTKPPSLSQYGGTSVHPPPRSIRVGARTFTVFIQGLSGAFAQLTREWGVLSRERIAQPVADKRNREHGHDQRNARRECHPRCRDDEIAAARDHVAPARSRRLNAESEERKPALEEDRVADAESRRDDRGTDGVGGHVTPEHL